jgi:hypothetical protein
MISKSREKTPTNYRGIQISRGETDQGNILSESA